MSRKCISNIQCFLCPLWDWSEVNPCCGPFILTKQTIWRPNCYFCLLCTHSTLLEVGAVHFCFSLSLFLFSFFCADFFQNMDLRTYGVVCKLYRWETVLIQIWDKQIKSDMTSTWAVSNLGSKKLRRAFSNFKTFWNVKHENKARYNM